MSLGIDMELMQRGSEQTNFGTMLLKLVRKADSHNRSLLRKSFPNAVEVYEHWERTGDIIDKDYD